MRQLTDQEKIQIWAEIDNEGLGYWIQNYSSAFDGTEYEALVRQTQVGINELETLISSFEGLLD